MEIKYHDNTKLSIEDEKRKFTFLDLAELGYNLGDNYKHFWVLSEYRELFKDKIWLDLISSFHYNGGEPAEIVFGYHINDIIRRTVKLDEDRLVKEDTIMFSNPRSIYENEYYFADIPPRTMLEDYICDDYRFYDGYDTARFKNSLLDDSILDTYLDYSDKYCSLLNHYSDDYETVNNIVKRFDDEDYLMSLEYDFNNKILIKKK